MLVLVVALVLMLVGVAMVPMFLIQVPTLWIIAQGKRFAPAFRLASTTLAHLRRHRRAMHVSHVHARARGACSYRRGGERRTRSQELDASACNQHAIHP